MIELTDKRNNKVMSIDELWKEANKFCNNRVVDNERYNGEYPLETRINQLITIKAIINEIDKFHAYAKKKEIKEKLKNNA